MPDEKNSDDRESQAKPVLEFHMTPPFMSPKGPVHPRLANAQEITAPIPMTVKVIANANTNG
jgi:hypothetical protein